MKQFWNFIRHRYFHFAATIMIIFLPLILFFNNQNQDQRGRAEGSTSFYFIPTSSSSFPIQKKVGETFYVDMMVNPGKNLASLIKVDISYDPEKISLSQNNPLVINEKTFPQVIEGPVYSSGRIQIVLSVGSDMSKVISSESKALTLNFVAKSSSSITTISFGTNSQVFSVASNDQSSQNVLSTTTPAYIKISESSK